jgi:glycosyltransferase involved in cell wall biosynthesis
MYTVIVPSLGRETYLIELLESIKLQTVEAKQIILLLDDNLHCHKIASNLPKISELEVVFCHNLNLAQKRNFGVAMASQNIVLFSDDDDVWMNLRAEKVIAALGSFQICCHNYGKFGAISEKNLSMLGTSDRPINSGYLLRGSNIFGGGSSIAANRAILAAFPFSPDYRYCEDFEWWSRVLLAGIPTIYLGASLVDYRTHSNNMTGSVRAISKFNFRLAWEIMGKGLILVLSSLAIIFRASLQMLKSYLFAGNRKS